MTTAILAAMGSPNGEGGPLGAQAPWKPAFASSSPTPRQPGDDFPQEDLDALVRRLTESLMRHSPPPALRWLSRWLSRWR